MNGLKSYFKPAVQKGPAGPPARTDGIKTPVPLRPMMEGPGTRSPTLLGTPQGSRGPTRPGSRSTSRPGSSHHNPLGDVEPEAILHLKAEMMVEYVWKQQRQKTWSADRPGEGVVLKKARGEYVCAPQSLARQQDGLFGAVRAMNVRVSHLSFAKPSPRSGRSSLMS